MQPFLIPDDFRAFMQEVVRALDQTSHDKLLDAEDAFQHETGYGGRVDGADGYRFTYLTSDGHHKWQLSLREPAIREIADGLLIEVPGDKLDIVRTRDRKATGEPLLVWGEYKEDALSIRDDEQLLAALDGLYESATDAPRMLRLWSTTDDQCVAVVWQGCCALYVVESVESYGTSTGDRSRNDSFACADHEGQPLVVPWADCIPWEAGRAGLLHFAQRGELGAEIHVEGRIPSSLLMMGDVDRAAALAARGAAASELKGTSITRMSPIPEEVIAADESTLPHELEVPLRMEELAAWARRLIEVLQTRALLELGPASLDEITYQLGGLLQAHGSEAQQSLDTAEWLANELGAVRGIGKLFATGGDLQVALRRSREAR